MNGALPPSSSDSRLIPSAASFISQRPTPVEPVKVILATFGLWQNSAPIALASSVVITEKAPFGTPARSASTASARAESGVCAAGFSTMVQPAASAGPTLRVIMPLGKFQGVIAAQTPTGCLSTRMRWFGAAPGMTSPSMRLASSANHSI